MILYRKGNRWALCPYKVKYKQHGEELEKYTADKQWWNDFAEKWDHTEVIGFEGAAWSNEQKERLQEIDNIPAGFGSACSNYVENGMFPEGNNHPLRLLQAHKENEEQGQDVTENEIEKMEQGQKQSDFEIRILELEANS